MTLELEPVCSMKGGFIEVLRLGIHPTISDGSPSDVIKACQKPEISFCQKIYSIKFQRSWNLKHSTFSSWESIPQWSKSIWCLFLINISRILCNKLLEWWKSVKTIKTLKRTHREASSIFIIHSSKETRHNCTKWCQTWLFKKTFTKP